MMFRFTPKNPQDHMTELEVAAWKSLSQRMVAEGMPEIKTEDFVISSEQLPLSASHDTEEPGINKPGGGNVENKSRIQDTKV